MKKRNLVWIIIGCVIAGVLALVLCLDGIVSRLAHKELAKQLAQMESPYAISFDAVFVRLLSGDADITGITVQDSTLRVTVDRVGVRNVSYTQLIKNHRVAIGRTLVRGVELHFKDPASPMVADVYNVSADVYDLCYNFDDSLFIYNDSVYSLSLDSAFFISPDNLHRVRATYVRTANAGPVELGPVHYQNNITKEEMIELMKEPIDWLSIDLKSLKTSPINIFKNIENSNGLRLDTIHADVQRFYVYRNTKYPPKHPYLMPQEPILASPFPFEINYVDARLNKMDVEVATEYINGGHLYVGPIAASVWNITNRKNAAMTCLVHGTMGQEGIFNARYRMVNDEDCHFEIDFAASNLELKNVDSFTKPICAITAEGRIDSLVTRYKGNRNEASGDFVMLYNNMHILVDKNEDVPIHFITKNAGLIQSVANTLLPKSNPPAGSNKARRYNTFAQRDVMQPTPIYMVWPLIDGIKSTLLPGFSMQKKIKTPKPAEHKKTANQ